MARKIRSVFYCSECGSTTEKWSGQCPVCKKWNTLIEKDYCELDNVDTALIEKMSNEFAKNITNTVLSFDISEHNKAVLSAYQKAPQSIKDAVDKLLDIK